MGQTFNLASSTKGNRASCDYALLVLRTTGVNTKDVMENLVEDTECSGWEMYSKHHTVTLYLIGFRNQKK